MNDQLTAITAALLTGTNYSTLSKTVIKGIVDQAADIVAEINRRFKGPHGDQ